MPTQHIGTKYQLEAEDDINAKLTIVTKQVKALELAKATTVVPKKTSTLCALCDTMGHSTDIYPIVAGVKEICVQVYAMNQFSRNKNNLFSNTYNLS